MTFSASALLPIELADCPELDDVPEADPPGALGAALRVAAGTAVCVARACDCAIPGAMRAYVLSSTGVKNHKPARAMSASPSNIITSRIFNSLEISHCYCAHSNDS